MWSTRANCGAATSPTRPVRAVHADGNNAVVDAAHTNTRDRLVEKARSMKVGDGLDAGVEMGPVISRRHRERVLGYVETGVSEGATLLVDGRSTAVMDRPDGFFVPSSCLSTGRHKCSGFSTSNVFAGLVSWSAT